MHAATKNQSDLCKVSRIYAKVRSIYAAQCKKMQAKSQIYAVSKKNQAFEPSSDQVRFMQIEKNRAAFFYLMVIPLL